jgi:hypothetical protein
LKITYHKKKGWWEWLKGGSELKSYYRKKKKKKKFQKLATAFSESALKELAWASGARAEYVLARETPWVQSSKALKFPPPTHHTYSGTCVHMGGPGTAFLQCAT